MKNISIAHSTSSPLFDRRLAVIGGLITVILSLLIYHGWLNPGIITAGDWVPTSDAEMRDDWPFFLIWGMKLGLGGSAGIFGSIFAPQYTIYGIVGHLGAGYALAERLAFYWPALIGGSLGGYLYALTISKRVAAGVIAGLFMVCNTYVDIVDGGGQLTVGCAFAFTPLILWAFRAALLRGRAFYYCLLGFFLALQGVYDLRFLYITIIMLVVYTVLLFVHSFLHCIAQFVWRLIQMSVSSTVIFMGIHAPWILQALLAKGAASSLSGPPGGYPDPNSVRSLSFMSMSNSLSLMHPFWPSNPLGHLAPLNPLLFVVPLMAFLIMLQRRLSVDIVFLLFITIVSMFLTKGAQEPDGELYVWAFLHIPEFQWFRDPSKFYQPLMVCLGVLWGVSLVQYADWLVVHLWRHMRRWMYAGLLLAGVVVTVYPAFPNIIRAQSGTVVPHLMPHDYQRLADFIDAQPEYFRTIWFPQSSRFMDYSMLHPSLYDAYALTSGLFTPQQLPNSNGYSWFLLPSAEHTLQALSVKYVIIPSPEVDEGIFTMGAQAGTTDMTFKNALSLARRALPGFYERTIGSVHLFENPSYLPIVYVPREVEATVAKVGVRSAYTLPQSVLERPSVGPIHDGEVSVLTAAMISQFSYSIPMQALPQVKATQVTASEIKVEVSNARQPYVAMLMQSYDSNWRAYIVPSRSVPSPLTLIRSDLALPSRTHVVGEGYANAWRISRRGTYSLVFLYWPQLLQNVGEIVCWFTICACLLCLVVSSTIHVHGQGWRRRQVQVRQGVTVISATSEGCK